MQHQEKYSFTWHSYSDHLKNTLKEMMTSSEFADVTLITDDKQQIRAHRSILGACSPVFKNILQLDSNNTNPVIYLRGIRSYEMESIMQFIYQGEARFYEEGMSEFLKVSKNLEIMGLSSGVVEMNNENDSNMENNMHVDNIADEEKNFEYDTLSTKNEDAVNDEHQRQTLPIIANKSDNRRLRKTVEVSGVIKFECQDCQRIFNSKPGLIYHIKSKHEGVKYACNHCDHKAVQKQDLARHIQCVHEGVKFACNQCDKQYSDTRKLTAHIKSKHEGVRYACNQCDYQATYKEILTYHIKSVHEGVKYACNQCDYQALKQVNLKHHIQSKHEGVKYGCNECDYNAVKKSTLRRHIQSVHE